ncbi:MAG: mechanosensitive ion channel family protein [Terracidiphilus sp.]|nr:mechanosensitive ion channel family protein [Terracidiphilus sp.]
MYTFALAIRAGWLTESHLFERVFNEWGDDAEGFLRYKLPHLLAVALIAFVLNRLLHLITARMISVAERHAAGHGQVAQVKTLAGVIRTTGLAVIGAIVGLQFLDALGINLAPLLASAGIAGVAIGLAAQNLVKDMLNGTLILVEDQFHVGDTVTLAGLSGVVETMTLRKTTVRAADGTLYVIPNSQITTVANQSIEYSVATMNVSVDFSADPDKVLALLKSIAMDVRTSKEFSDLFVDDPKVLGVDALKGSQLIIPVQFKTRAQKQFAPMREFQRRVRLALEENHLLPGDPYRVFSSFGTRDDDQAGNMPARRPEEAAASGVDPTTIKAQESNPFSGE